MGGGSPARKHSGAETTAKMGKPTKIRVDQALVAHGLAESRTRAQALIMAGVVFVGETKIEKPGQQVAEDAALDVRGRDHPWARRGGFTDVLLSKGASHVFAVDSGTNQLAWKLRSDERVTVLEQTNARHLTPELIDRACDWVVCDASFIGLAKVLERPLALAAPDARAVVLVKPQFEVARHEVGKGGVVRDPVLHERVCDEARAWFEAQGWSVDGILPSPITGPEGNVEFLLAARRGRLSPGDVPSPDSGPA